MPYDDSLDPYLGTSGPRTVTGPARGSPAGMMPMQAGDVSNFALTRERIQRELEGNPWLRRELDRNTTAEMGNTASPEARRWYQALTIDRAVQSGRPLAEIVNNPNYYPITTRRQTATTGQQPDPSLWQGANPANYATGNSSFDPVTGRWVGFQGGPQVSVMQTPSGPELGGIEGQEGLRYARTMGYQGPIATVIGPSGPHGPGDVTPMDYTQPRMAYGVLARAADNPADSAILGGTPAGLPMQPEDREGGVAYRTPAGEGVYNAAGAPAYTPGTPPSQSTAAAAYDPDYSSNLATGSGSVRATNTPLTMAQAMLAKTNRERDAKEWDQIFANLRMPGGTPSLIKTAF